MCRFLNIVILDVGGVDGNVCVCGFVVGWIGVFGVVNESYGSGKKSGCFLWGIVLVMREGGGGR